MYLQILLTLLCTLALASAFPHPEAFDKHDLDIRAPAVALRDHPVAKDLPVLYHRESYKRKSALRARSPAEIHIPASQRYTPATCVEPECEKICICHQHPGAKAPKLVPYPWIKPEVPCIELCRYEACSCSTPKAF